MIPFKDENPTTVFPFVAIGLNVLLYLGELFSSHGEGRIAHFYGVIPYDLITHGTNQPIPPRATVFSSMFLYGILLYLGGNMLYFWIFGNNIEDGKGHFRLLDFCPIEGHRCPYACLPLLIGLFFRARVRTVLFFSSFSRGEHTLAVASLIVIGFSAIIQCINTIVTKGC
ncbi:MAG TPA: hypothetical protein DCP92_22570 [Nitrospiraceae bacterium]|nr:hypothetical protein [Nitrospiraceae bacterium]